MSALDLLLVHAAATWALVGLTWTVQLVQYPGFVRVGAREFARFHEHHCNAIAWIVGPLMGIEGVSGLVLWFQPPEGVSTAWLAAGLVAIPLHLALTGLFAVPLHGRQRAGETRSLRALLLVHGLRTLLWSWRGVWVLLTLRGAL